MQLEQTLRKLVSFKTVTDDKKINKEALRWCERELKKASSGLYIRRYESGGHPSLIVTTKRTKKPIVWLLAHVDVVPAPESLFTLNKRGGRIYGRGTFDMKYAISAYIELIRELGKDVSQYNFGIMLTSDEETGGAFGVKKIIEDGYRSKVCIAPDGGQHWELETQAKGFFHLAFSANGRSSHGSRPWEGVNALMRLIDFLVTTLKAVNPKGTKDNFENTFDITAMHAGQVVNQIPDHARALVDVRFPNKKAGEVIRKKKYKTISENTQMFR